jgi:hypothetical protein
MSNIGTTCKVKKTQDFRLLRRRLDWFQLGLSLEVTTNSINTLRSFIAPPPFHTFSDIVKGAQFQDLTKYNCCEIFCSIDLLVMREKAISDCKL